MNKILKILSIPLICGVCNAQEICGLPVKKDKDDARERALASLALSVKSSYSSQSVSVETINGYESSVKDTTIRRLTSELKNAQNVEYKETADNSIIACITRKGVYIQSNDNVFSERFVGKISSMLTADYVGCVFSEDEESSVLLLKVNYSDCKRENKSSPMGDISICRACGSVELADNKTGKSIEKVSLSDKGTKFEMETACEEAADNAAVSVWNRIKSKIKKGDYCK